MNLNVGQCVSPAPPGGLPAEERAGKTHCPTLTSNARPYYFSSFKTARNCFMAGERTLFFL